jgi:hypothetical protein
MDLALTQPLRGSINYVRAGDLVAPATPSQVTGHLGDCSPRDGQAGSYPVKRSEPGLMGKRWR